MCVYTHFKHFLWCISPFAKVGVVSICENMKDISSLVKLQWIKNPDEHQERDYYDLPFAERVTWKTNLEPNVWPILQKQVIFGANVIIQLKSYLKVFKNAIYPFFDDFAEK